MSDESMNSTANSGIPGSGLLGFASGVGGILNGISSIGNMIVSAKNAKATQQLNRENLEFQKEAYEYQKMLNEQTMQREDTSHQREVADLIKSGLSPYAAIGGASAANLSAPVAPGNDISGVASSLGHITSAIGNADFSYAAQGVESTLNYISSEKRRIHEEEMDNIKNNISLASLELDRAENDRKERMAQLDEKLKTIQADVSINEEDRKKALHEVELQQRALDIQAKYISNQRDSISLNIDKKTENFKVALQEAQVNSLKAQIAKALADVDLVKVQTLVQKVGVDKARKELILMDKEFAHKVTVWEKSLEMSQKEMDWKKKVENKNFIKNTVMESINTVLDGIATFIPFSGHKSSTYSTTFDKEGNITGSTHVENYSGLGN